MLFFQNFREKNPLIDLRHSHALILAGHKPNIIISNTLLLNYDCNCRSKLVSQLTNGQLNSNCDDKKIRRHVDLYRFIMKTGQSASHNRLWQ